MQEDNNKQKEEEDKEDKIVEIIEEEKVEEIFEEGKSIDDVIQEDIQKSKQQNYLAIIILLLGALLGSLFVDVAQFVSKKGYSPKALKETNIFTLDDKTWVAYKEPIVKLDVLTVSDEDLKNCPTCKPSKEVMDLFKKVMPTLVVNEIDKDSEAGKKMIAEYNIKSVPALVFSKDLEKTDFYNGEAKALFDKINDKGYTLNLSALGLPIGEYIETPTIDDNNATIGNKDAKVKIFLFSDHQCPFCAKFFDEIVTTSKSFGDKVVLVYKDLPLEFHSQSMNAAIAGECAKDQGKFWEMSQRLYNTQKQWGNLKDDKAKGFFKQQAKRLGLDMEKFDGCLENGEHKDSIEKSKKEAEAFGITGTPSVFINDQFVPGVIPADKLKEMIQAEIDKAEGVDKNTEETKKTEETK